MEPVPGPQSPSGAADPRGVAAASKHAAIAGRRVLIVEDSGLQARYLTEILESAGVVVTAVVNADEALRALEQARYELVMSDIVMPRMSGYELCRAIKANPRTQSIPVVLLTALNDAAEIIAGLAAGAENFITKPYDPDCLLDRVRRVLHGAPGDDPPASDPFVAISSSKQQIMSFLLSTFEDYARGKQREKEILRQEAENKRKAAAAMARQAKELEETNRDLAQANHALAKLNEELAHKSDQLASARDRLANSYDDLKKDQALLEIESRRMEVELQTARSVQRMLIPKSPPRDIPGFDFAFRYMPATEAGGDWLGFIDDRASRQLAILIGDVTGHGVGAALMTAAVCSFFSTLRRRGASLAGSLADLLTLLHQVITDMGGDELAMTFFLSVLDYEHRVLRYAGAGHPCPLLLPAAAAAEPAPDRCIVPLMARGTPLGMTVPPHHEERSRQLERGDVVVWFTDGLVENCDPANVPVRERTLRRWLGPLYGASPETICSELEARLRAFMGSQPPADDMALIVARVL